MAITTEPVTRSADDGGKGLKTGALGLASSIVIGVASTAPAYSLAATLGLIVALTGIGLQAPAIVVLAFVPILFVSIGYQQLNKREPDCGTTFTWATKAFGPKTGWMGGWGIVAADILVMASLAQVAGLYIFLLFGDTGISGNSGWVLLLGLLWMVLMTYICYRGIEISARIQQALLALEVVVLVIFAVTALVHVYGGTGATFTCNPAKLIQDLKAAQLDPTSQTCPTTALQHLSSHPALSWFNPFHIGSINTFAQGIILMLFIYWGWDSAVAVNEETKDREKTPGRAAIISTVLLLVTYVIVTVAAQAYAGVGQTVGSVGLGSPTNSGDILSVVGNAAFGNSAFGTVMSKLLILLVLTSAAACTQTTILPTARTTLSMAAFKSIPATFARIHPRYLTPTSSTLWMGAISALVYVAMNFYSGGGLISDAVTSIGVMIAFYYGLTGFACAWYYRKELHGVSNFLLRGFIPFLGGVMLFGGMILTLIQDWKPVNSYVLFTIPFTHKQIGWAFVLGVGTVVVGLILMLISTFVYKPFFAGETLNRDTPIFLADDAPITANLLPDSREALVLPPDQRL